MRRRDFLTSAAAAAAPFVFVRTGSARQNQQARLARIAIMSLTFGSILKNANAPDSPTRTLDLMDLGEMYADRFGVHNVELQHSYLPSTDPGWLQAFRRRLESTKSRVTNINLEFGGTMTMTAESPVGRQQAIDLTRRWIEHAAILGCPRVMVNQGTPTEENKATAIAVLRTMNDYGKTRGVKVSVENRAAAGGGRRGSDAPAAPAGPPPPAPPPPHILLTEIIKASGAYANVDLANFGDQPVQHAGMRAMFPYTVGNTHMRLNVARYDLPAALKIMRDEIKYQGIYLIEAGIPAGPDPFQAIADVRAVVLEHM